ncbi:PGPGW domain-containing protein [Nocardioides lianchengensis]|nr:PGPGW domain-containing protein [Nocardioides lianchengensis]NYG12230.1 hypothetical protein [Nocardioides lianchengensis]
MRRTAMQGLGWVLTIGGVILFPLPGPGLLLLAAGLAILAEHYAWAERRVDQVKVRAWAGARVGVRTPWRTFWTVLVTALLGASGVLWLWAPPRPDWWVLPAWTWLPGGVWSGVGQLLSGAVALALVGYAWWRVRGERVAGRGDPRCGV